MPKFRVHGTIEMSIDILVDAKDKEEAIEKAHDDWPGVTGYCGNGKLGGALVGPHQDDSDANMEDCGAEPKFHDAVEA